MKKEVLWTLSPPFGLLRLILRQINKEVDEEKRQYITSALTAISDRNCLDQCPIAVLEL